MERRGMMLLDGDVFTPDRFEIKVNYASLTKRATVNVATSTDVVGVTVNGIYNRYGTAGDTHSFAVSFTGVQANTEFKVIGYNSYGLPTETHIVTAG